MSDKTISELKHAANEWAGASALAASARARGVGWREQKRKQTSRESFKNVFLGMLTALEDRITALEAEVARLREDAARLDYMLANDAFLFRKRADSGAMTFQIWTQDEDENYTVLSGDHWFNSDLDTEIDAAVRGDGGEG